MSRPHAPKLTREDWSSLIGIVTAIIGNVLISFALNTQRYAHIRLEREANLRRTSSEIDEDPQARLADERSRKNAQATSRPTQNGHAVNDEESEETDPLLPKSADSGLDSVSSISGVPGNEKSNEQRERENYLRSPYWWIGIILMIIGEAGNFLAYGFAPASIVSPLGVVALISNCLIAPIMLKEQFRKRDLLGVLIAVGGAVTVVLSAKGSNPKLGPDKIWDLIKEWEFLTYLGITVVLIIILSVASNRYGQRTIMVDIGLVGLFGGYTALATKGVASLFSYRLFDVFTFWISYLLVLVLVVTAVMQIKYVNRALQRFDSTQVIPTQFVTFTISVVVGSAILYRDFEKTTAQKLGQFVGGVFLTFLGVWCITSGRSQRSIGADFDGDEEHEIDLVDEEITPIPSPPSTPKPNRPGQSVPSAPSADSPASFATASSHLDRSPSMSKKPPIQASSSSPILPPSSRTRNTRSQSNAHAPATPSSLARPYNPTHSNSETSVSHTPLNSNTTSTPVSSSVPRHYLSRHSIAAGMTPGPYLSPLNAGVSVILSNSRRRGSSTSVQQQQQQQQRPIGRRRNTRHRASVPDVDTLHDDGNPATPGAAVEDSSRHGSTSDTVDDQVGSAPT